MLPQPKELELEQKKESGMGVKHMSGCWGSDRQRRGVGDRLNQLENRIIRVP